MKVLLTGASGFIGKNVIEALITNGIDFVTVGRRKPNLSKNHINSDLLSTDSFDKIVNTAQASHLIHLAWYAEHGKYWTSPLNYKWVEATSLLVEAFCNSGGRGVVVAGTCAEYDWSHGNCNEQSTPTNPSTLYGISKNKTRKLVMRICEQHSIPCSWGRIFFPYGENENPKRLIPSLISVFRDEKSPFGVNKNQYRDFLHVSDVAEAFLFLMLKGQTGVFNVSSGESIKISELVHIIAELLKDNPKKILDLTSERRGEPKIIVGENIKLKSLGWEVKHSLISGLEELLKI